MFNLCVALPRQSMRTSPWPMFLNLSGACASRADLFEALQPKEISASHLFVVSEISWLAGSMSVLRGKKRPMGRQMMRA